MVKRAAVIGAVVCASVLLHLVFVGVIVLAEHWPLPSSQTQVMDVELVQPEDIPKPPEPPPPQQTLSEKKKPETAQAPLAPAPSAPAPQNPDGDRSLAPPQATQAPAPDRTEKPVPPSASGGPPSESKSKLTLEDVAVLRAQIQKCWTLPVGTPNAGQLTAVIRIALGRDGRLVAEPELLKASALTQGPILVGIAMRALRECAPYRGLPAAKFDDWKLLDLGFTAVGMTGFAAPDRGQKSGPAKR